jgi:hypothetical protein
MSAGPAVYQRVLRSLPLWLLREYLVELGGQAESDVCVRGPAWQAGLEQIEDFAVGSLVVGQVRLTVTAEAGAAEALFPLLDQKLLRAGG